MPTICFTGMDRAEEAKLKHLFAEANNRLGGEWNLVAEAQARVLVVDMESMYGHMTWLKAHKTKQVIAVSSHPDCEADQVLLRPVTVDSLVYALGQAAAGHVTHAAAITGSHPVVGAVPAAPPAAVPAPVAPPQSPAQPPAAKRAAAPPPRPAPPAPAPALPPTPVPAPAAAPARDPVMWNYLQPGGLSGPSQLDIEDAPSLVIDPRSDSYIGGPTLKPYLPYCDLGTLRADRWKSLSGAEVNKHLVGNHVMQPLARLRWLYALVQGHGELAPGYDPDNQYRLNKWPKAEREFPRHMRIATAMMQAPGTPADIAARSDSPLADVNDFINASLESGFAEAVASQPSGTTGGGKPGGLLSRLRGGR
ncbi:MAG: hypothetical protein JSR34_02930 [Proteobacteria bacterium]|nr:hypothetical protein [Pseudomonadota bacterium]